MCKYWKGELWLWSISGPRVEISLVELEAKEQLIIHLKATSNFSSSDGITLLSQHMQLIQPLDMFTPHIYTKHI